MSKKGSESESQVAILMGSSSDLGVVQGGMKILDSLHIGYEVEVLSAHRTPEQVRSYAQSAEQRGLKILIAAAGGAAHLPGVVAAYTPLPVIGIPIPSGLPDGMDALLSMCQMPAGVPVATMGVGSWGAKNAALLAARILSLTDKTLGGRLEDFRRHMEKEAMEKGREAKESLEKD